MHIALNIESTTQKQVTMNTSFEEDKKRGKVGEQIFKEDFLDFMDIHYQDVTDRQQFQVIDTDYLTKIGTYEVKANYKDNKILIFEDWSKVEQKKRGWVYTTKANLLVFVSKKTRTMIFLPFTDRFKAHYKYIRENTEAKTNTTQGAYGHKWTSQYRKVPFDMLDGFISVYKRKPTIIAEDEVSFPAFLQ